LAKCGIKIIKKEADKGDRRLDSSIASGINQKKRTFSYLRHLILISMVKGPQSINQVSNVSGINWRTVENHMVHLMGKGLIKIAYNTPYIRIYDLTEDGKKYLQFLKQRYQKTHIKNVDIESLDDIKDMQREFVKIYAAHPEIFNDGGDLP